MATAPNFYPDPNRPMPAVGQNPGQPDSIYHSEFAATQYGDSPHPVFDGPPLPRDPALQVSLAKLEAKVDEIQDMTRRILNHTKVVETQTLPNDLKTQLETIQEGLERRNRLETLDDKLEKVVDWVQQIAKKITDLYKMTELNMSRRN